MTFDDHPPQSSPPHPTLAVFGTDGQPDPGTVIDIARAAMDRYPDAVAIDCGGDQLTYGEFSLILDEQVDRLRRLGIGRGDRVGIRVPPGSMQTYVAFLAVIFAGATSVPVDWDDPEERTQAVWETARVAVVYGADLTLTVRQPRDRTPDTSAPGPDDIAWILFSGPPDALEGVATTHRSAAGIAHAQSSAYLTASPLGPGDRIMTRHSLATRPATRTMWLSWSAGATLVPAPCEAVTSHQKLFAWIIDQQITVVAATPSMAAAWPQRTLDRVRLLILIGQDTPRTVLEQLDRPGLEIWTAYADTFTTARLDSGLTPATPPESVGGPIPGMRLCVIDPDGEPVRWGRTGEVVVAGPGLDHHLDPAVDAEHHPPLPSLGWQRVHFTGVLVRAERDGLVPVDPHGKPTRASAPRRGWRWWPTR